MEKKLNGSAGDPDILRFGEQSIDARAQIAEFRLGVDYDDMETFLRWMEKPDVQSHLDPVPRIPDWGNPRDIEEAKIDLWQYYRNITPEDSSNTPSDLQPITALNQFGEPVGVLTIRWRGDKFVPRSKRIASIERLVVNPDLHHHGIGKQLVTRANDFAFHEYDGYKDGQSAVEMRAWVMADDKSGPYHININLFNKLGFNMMQQPRSTWSKYAEAIGIETDREAYCFKLKKEDWEMRSQVIPQGEGITLPQKAAE